jgi:5'-nucleotidase / UDP-sugar diphosphatase
MLNTIIGRTNVDLDGNKSRVRSRETNLGDMMADAMMNKTASLGASIAILNAGGIRSSVPAGDFSLGQVLQIAPFGNYLTVLKLSGPQIIAALENGVSQVDQEAGRFPQVAGMRYTWNPQAPTGNRIISVEVKSGGSYQPIDSGAIYGVVTIDFVAGGGDGYSVLREAGEVYNTEFVDFEVLRDYVQTNSPLNPVIEGRIIRSGE